MSTFAKYQQRGAYHWRAFTRNPLRLDLFTKSRYQVVLDNAAIANVETIVDLGCGDGALTGALAHRNRNGRTIGVEPEPVGRALAVQQCQKFGIRAEFVADSKSLKDGIADLVVCAEVIEHVQSPEALLQEIQRLLRPGGRLVLTTPVRLTERPLDQEHVHEFYPGELVELVHPYLVVKGKHYCFSVFAAAFYKWCPVVFFRRGVIRLAINALYLTTGWNFLQQVKADNPYWITQVVIAVKAP